MYEQEVINKGRTAFGSCQLNSHVAVRSNESAWKSVCFQCCYLPSMKFSLIWLFTGWNFPVCNRCILKDEGHLKGLPGPVMRISGRWAGGLRGWISEHSSMCRNRIPLWGEPIEEGPAPNVHGLSSHQPLNHSLFLPGMSDSNYHHHHHCFHCPYSYFYQ